MYVCGLTGLADFNPLASERRDEHELCAHARESISIHSPLRGETRAKSLLIHVILDFNPLASERRDSSHSAHGRSMGLFQSTRL